MVHFAFLSLLTLIPLALSKPTGAPKCAINPAVVSATHTNVADLGFVLEVPATYTPGGPAIEIKVTKGVEFKGILTYVTPGADDDVLAAKKNPKHIGKFTLPDGLRAQTASVCDDAKIVNEFPESTITHSKPGKFGGAAPFSLMWTPPKDDMGVVTINMAISTGPPSTGQMTFLKGVQIASSTGGAGAKNDAPPTVNSPGYTPKRYQCRMKSKSGGAKNSYGMTKY
ncbi:hypothetical protein HDU97_009088 [Phlyctochytrium planicorne]|nr:hypothetical protein HDU97_009088 [Phlyctochytrium planicorne]